MKNITKIIIIIGVGCAVIIIIIVIIIKSNTFLLISNLGSCNKLCCAGSDFMRTDNKFFILAHM